MSVWWSQALSVSLLVMIGVSVRLCQVVPLSFGLNLAVLCLALPLASLIVLARAYLRGPLPPDDPLLAEWYEAVSAQR